MKTCSSTLGSATDRFPENEPALLVSVLLLFSEWKKTALKKAEEIKLADIERTDNVVFGPHKVTPREISTRHVQFYRRKATDIHPLEEFLQLYHASSSISVLSFGLQNQKLESARYKEGGLVWKEKRRNSR